MADTTSLSPIMRQIDGQKSLLIDGKLCADMVLAHVASHTGALMAAKGEKPGLAVVLVGDDPASAVYVRNKTKAAERCGFALIEHHLPATASQTEVAGLVASLDANPLVHGILVQLPLPKGLDASSILAKISPIKDVDGFDPLNLGRLAGGNAKAGFVACTPAGAMILLFHALKALGRSFKGAEAVVIGRSTTVGRPMGLLLLNADCTVTLAHSRTQNLPEVMRRADIVVAAVGRAEMVKGDWIKEGAVVIDVGINKITLPDGKSRLVGDVAFAEAASRAGAITPVPGGVGPMTIALLMANTLTAACRRVGFAEVDLG